MESQKLFTKYNDGRHWEQHPTIYAESFCAFLRDQGFHGKIVDIGCGNGRDVHVFSKAGFSVLGVDYDPEVLRRAQERFPLEHLQVDSVEHLSIPSSSVDACFMINVIHYVKQREALQEIFRILTPGGLAFIHWNLSIVDQAGKVDYQQDKDQILDMVTQFTIMRQVIFERFDALPIPHRHTILELIVRKPDRT